MDSVMLLTSRYAGSGTVIRATARKRDQPQIEDESNLPFWLAEDAVVN
jgi:hypothetical protein